MDGRSTKFLFVYGTLMKGFRDNWQARVGARLVGHGCITGKLYDLGDYPGAVSSGDKEDLVKGELYELNEPVPAMKILDEYEEFSPAQPEKSLFVRRVVPVTMRDRSRKKAWAYFYNRDVGGAHYIPEGDYRDRIPTRR